MWTKDTVSEAPKILYTPGSGDVASSVARVVYDPDAADGEKYTAVMSGVHSADEAIADFEVAIGL